VIAAGPNAIGRTGWPELSIRACGFLLAGMRAVGVGCDAHAVRCLIVDDNPGFLAAARRLLEREGVMVVGVAPNSAEALLRAEEARPDVVLVDIDLGGESGLELAGRLQRQTHLTPFRTILVSTHDEQDYRDLIAASPAVGFLSKASLSAHALRELFGDDG
jgi:DNA-binding NarL/FixJ family response regulator